jgi:hypothetical protein
LLLAHRVARNCGFGFSGVLVLDGASAYLYMLIDC